ncbi:hypothetical protein i01_04130 [Escherichia coli cloneA_i1]|nr:hypothetical protein i01_04130 [Escherichia coli cloneA_i1]
MSMMAEQTCYQTKCLKRVIFVSMRFLRCINIYDLDHKPIL